MSRYSHPYLNSQTAQQHPGCNAGRRALADPPSDSEPGRHKRQKHMERHSLNSARESRLSRGLCRNTRTFKGNDAATDAGHAVTVIHKSVRQLLNRVDDPLRPVLALYLWCLLVKFAQWCAWTPGRLADLHRASGTDNFPDARRMSALIAGLSPPGANSWRHYASAASEECPGITIMADAIGAGNAAANMGLPEDTRTG